MNYLLHLLIMLSIYSLLTLSLNILVGYTGLLSFCHSAFYGIGAYTTALLMMKMGLGFLPSLLAGIAIASLMGFLVSLPALKLRGDYFYLTTLGFQMFIFSLFNNWVGLTNGPYGIPDIPFPKFFAFQVDTLVKFAFFSFFVSSFCLFLLWRILNSPFGRALKTIREDEILSATLGKNIHRLKIFAFVLSSGFSAIAGALFACYMRYIDPTSFTLAESFFILSATLLGGTGNIKGPLLGTLFVILLPELLRYIHISDAISANLRQILYGITILVLMRYRPQGLGGIYKLR